MPLAARCRIALANSCLLSEHTPGPASRTGGPGRLTEPATKVIPFALIPLAVAARTPHWVVVILALLGVAQVVTDVLLSTKTSDWKRFRREIRNAHTE
jgi:hypothetical protein